MRGIRGPALALDKQDDNEKGYTSLKSLIAREELNSFHPARKREMHIARK